MTYGKYVAAALLALSASPATAGGGVGLALSYAIETSRFDAVMAVTVDDPTPMFEDSMAGPPKGKFDVIVCNQALEKGDALPDLNGPVTVPAGRCVFFENLQTLSLARNPMANKIWHGTVYIRFANPHT